MSELLIREVTPTAAALACAVADRDHDEVARVLQQLDTQHLHALAIVLADHIDPDKPFTHRRAPDPDAALFDALLKVTALRFHVTPPDILSRSRRREHSDARAVVCYAAHRLGFTYSGTGERLGRDHSTVMHAYGRVGSDRRLRGAADSILATLHPPQEIAS